MNKINNVSAIVLAGGLSTRIGRDKGQLLLDRKSLAKRVLENIDRLFERVIYVINDPALAPSFPEITLAKDDIPHLGPLGGMLAGLKTAEDDSSFVVGYDMPFVSYELVKLLVEYDDEADVIVPRIRSKYEPLHAIYSKKCVPFIAKQLSDGNNKIIDIFKDLKVAVVEEDIIRKVDPEFHSFFNINTWDDLKYASSLLKKRRK